ncbi:MAG: DNA polymerase III subunit alpha [Alphaproteobacteria bacterium]|nr:DNA polymerase III subunit alpha [Alphaproteobacteria bacterium]
MKPKFIHLHVHTAYSLLEGAIKMPKLAKWASDNKMPAIAMTDTGNICGAMAMMHEMPPLGIQPILGTQILVKSPKQNAGSLDTTEDTFDKVVLLVQNETGYKHLLKLFSFYYMGADKQQTPHITFDELCEHTDGLICLTGGWEGLIGRPLLAGKYEYAKQIAQKMQNAFGDRLYIELMRHGMDQEQQTEEDFLQLALDLNIPIVATNDAYFLTPDMYEAQDALMCIAEKKVLSDEDRRRLTPEHYLKTEDQMCELFSDLPEALANSVLIARRCAFMAEKKKPAFPNFDCKGKTEDEVLADMAEAGFKIRMQGRSPEEQQKYHDQMLFELGVIKQMGFPGYFLIVADFIQWSKNNGVPVGPGRGSGAGSVVAWCLMITDIDPMRFDLVFERFLNPERVNMPDIDVDFCQERREKTIEYVQNHYGFDHVAQIITFGKLQAKAVIRDVGRVMQVPFPVVDRLSKMIPNDPKITLEKAFEQEPRLKEEIEAEEQIKELFAIAVKLEGLFRNTSTHAAGVVIGNKPLDEIVPIYKDPSSDMPVTQFDMKYVEEASLIKFDFLGLKTLTTIKKTLELLQKRGIEVDIDHIPLDDPETFKLLRAADTTGVFQLESTGMKKILHDMQPDKIEDIVALVSLYRPGPMDSIPTYIAVKKGLEEPDYMHPMLEPILKETYGIMIYQEQVMQISRDMAGFSLGGADLLRRIMGKKKAELLPPERVKFIEGAKAKGVSQDVAEKVFDKMAKFASYGFNKAHAAAYAFIAYQTAYLKAHFPAEFMAATMTLDKINTDKLAIFKEDVLAHKIEVLQPDINLSEVNFTVQDGKVRYALSAVKNVGEAGMMAVVAEREKNGPFKSIQDFASRVDVSALNKRYVENLAKSGAFECIEKNRAMVFNNVENIVSYAAQATQGRNSAQMGLFGADASANALKLTRYPEWPQMEKLEHEKEALGFYLSAHPLDSYSTVLERLRAVDYADVAPMVSASPAVRTYLAVIVSDVRERISQKGNRFAFISASDKSGSFDLMCFSDVLETHREKLKSGQPLLLAISAVKREGEDQIRINIQDVIYLSDAMAKTQTTLIVRLENVQAVEDIKKRLEKVPTGRSKIFLILKTKEYDVEFELPNRYTLTPDVMDDLSQILGVAEIKQV